MGEGVWGRVGGDLIDEVKSGGALSEAAMYIMLIPAANRGSGWL